MFKSTGYEGKLAIPGPATRARSLDTPPPARGALIERQQVRVTAVDGQAAFLLTRRIALVGSRGWCQYGAT